MEDRVVLVGNAGAGKVAAIDYMKHMIAERHPLLVAEPFLITAREEYEYPEFHKEYIQPRKVIVKLSRNSLCYCGSRKKYKRCCINKDDE